MAPPPAAGTEPATGPTRRAGCDGTSSDRRSVPRGQLHPNSRGDGASRPRPSSRSRSVDGARRIERTRPTPHRPREARSPSALAGCPTDDAHGRSCTTRCRSRVSSRRIERVRCQCRGCRPAAVCRSRCATTTGCGSGVGEGPGPDPARRSWVWTDRVRTERSDRSTPRVRLSSPFAPGSIRGTGGYRGRRRCDG